MSTLRHMPSGIDWHPHHPAEGAVLQRTCACGGTLGPTGECAQCRRKRKLREGTLQTKLRISHPGDRYEREADRVAEQVMLSPLVEGASPTLPSIRCVASGVGIGSGEEAPPVVHEVLHAPGRPLDGSTRNFMEQRFGHDFGAVRVHTDAQAVESARAVGAVAYTVGQDIAFDTGQFRPATAAGRHLLAHELVHTMQQREGARRWIARRGPMPRPPVRTQPATGVLPRGGPRYGMPPRNLSELAEAMRRRGQVLAAERTIVVLSRGGSAPDFITEHEQLGAWEWGNARYTVRHFHILDAIEHDVMQATTQQDLIRILRTFIPEALPEDQLSEAGRFILDPRLFGVDFPENFDPGAEERLRVFWEAYERRNRQLQAEEEAEAERETERRRTTVAEPQECVAAGPPPRPDMDTDLAYGHCDEYGCEIEPIAQQFGRYPCHADFARSLSGVSREFRVTTPEGVTADFDAMDWGGALYEVKTGYRWIAFTSNEEMRQSTIGRFIEQSQRQVVVAERCHRTLDWYFNDDQAAAFFDPFVQPPVHHVPFDCNRDSDD